MRIVVALGGNALLRRGEDMTIENQVANVKQACDHLAPLVVDHQLVISHGNGPQIGLLALEAAAYTEVPSYPLDVLGAETQGMLGYLIQRELENRIDSERSIASLLTMIEVDANDEAFSNPSKPIGPLYSKEEADALTRTKEWSFHTDADKCRRVVPSPKPKRIIETEQIDLVLRSGSVVICAGGGGIPVAYSDDKLVGIEAVIDKDFASCLLAQNLDADLFVMATDAPNVFLKHGQPDQETVKTAHPDDILTELDQFGEGSMKPKVLAAVEFTKATGCPAVIGQLSDIEKLVFGEAGTTISRTFRGITTENETRR